MVGLFQDFNPMRSLAANQYGFSAKAINSGSLITFHYPQSFAMIPNVIHDPNPMVILTDIWPTYIRGVNLHYLVFPKIKELIMSYGESGSYNYQAHVKPSKYIAHAFRMYNRKGVQRIKKLDTEWLKQVLQSVRSFDPAEIEKMKAQIQNQIQARLQAKASELTNYEQWRANMARAQQRQLDQTNQGLLDAITRGQNQGLITPESNFGTPDFGTPAVQPGQAPITGPNPPPGAAPGQTNNV